MAELGVDGRRSARRSRGSSAAAPCAAARRRRRRVPVRARRGAMREGDRADLRAAAGAAWPTAGCWRCSRVPESERDKRHLLRTRLARLGFGTVGARGLGGAAGSWPTRSARCSPAHGLAGYVDLFGGRAPRFRRPGGGCAPGGTSTSWPRATPGSSAATGRSADRLARTPAQRRRGLRRLRPDAHRLAAAALPRPRPAARAAAGPLGRRGGRRSCSTSSARCCAGRPTGTPCG